MDTRLIHLAETASTQDVAADSYDGAAVLVVAQRQTDARGRSGARWESAPRSLAMSLAFPLSWPRSMWPQVALAVGLSVASVIQGTSLKWPNDVLKGPKKVGGILVEANTAHVVAGVGLNLWWPSAPAGYGSVYSEDPGPKHSYQLAAEIARQLLARVALGAGDWGLDEYRSLCVTVGTDVTWEPSGVGRAVGVADSGALEVETPSGMVELVSGEVRHVRSIG